jgi:hypothetical protein
MPYTFQITSPLLSVRENHPHFRILKSCRIQLPIDPSPKNTDSHMTQSSKPNLQISPIAQNQISVTYPSNCPRIMSKHTELLNQNTNDSSLVISIIENSVVTENHEISSSLHSVNLLYTFWKSTFFINAQVTNIVIAHVVMNILKQNNN